MIFCQNVHHVHGAYVSISYVHGCMMAVPFVVSSLPRGQIALYWRDRKGLCLSRERNPTYIVIGIPARVKACQSFIKGDEESPF